MAENTKIAWCDATVNLVAGCTKVSPGCANCYAAERDKRHLQGKISHWGAGAPRHVFKGFSFECARLNRKAKKLGKRLRVFPNSLSDWLDEEWPAVALVSFFDTIRWCQHLDFLTLTKRPENFERRIEFALDHIESDSKWASNSGLFSHPLEPVRDFLADWLVLRKPPANIWIGATVENQEMWEKRKHDFLAIPASVHFISHEPSLGLLKIEPECLGESGVNWVIAGGESGTNARPMKIEWAQSLRDQCKSAGVAFFMKQIGGSRKPFPEIPADLMIREFPCIQN